MNILDLLPWKDWLALASFFALWAGYALFARKGARSERTLLAATNRYRAVHADTVEDVVALDTGCLWGGKLTAMNIETKVIVQVDSSPLDKPIKLNAIKA